MTNESGTFTELQQFGAKLKTAREALKLSTETIATQLRLSPSTIIQLENGEACLRFPSVFIRGYLRTYAKYLQIDENEIQHILEQITDHPRTVMPDTLRKILPSSSHYRHAKIFLSLMAVLWMGCGAIWWAMHSTSFSRGEAKKSIISEPVLAVSKPSSEISSQTFNVPPNSAKNLSSEAPHPIAKMAQSETNNDNNDENDNTNDEE